MNNLIEELSNLRSQFNCFDENERNAYHTLSEAINVLSERPEPSACWACNCPKMQLLEKDTTFGKWIPCSETIDIPDHEVLCCDRFGEELIGWLSYNDDQWLCESDGEMMYDPIAWREKPKPYREESETDE